MDLKSLNAHNILSLGDVELSFQDDGLVLLDGWNHDDGSSNGSGKTSIFNTLSFAVFGKIPRKITASEILRKGAKSGFAKAVFAVGDNIWEVTRGRPTSLEIKKNDEVLNITQEEFERSIGLSYEQFLICMYSSQTESMKLLGLNDSAKKDFFLQLMNLDEFVDKKKQVDLIIKGKEKELAEVDMMKSKLEAKFTVYEEQLVDEDALLKAIADNAVDDLLKVLEEMGEVSQPDLSKFELLEDKIQKRSMEILRLHEAAQTAKQKLDRVSKLKYSPNTQCPHCNEFFSVTKTGECATEKDFNEEITNITYECVATIEAYESLIPEENQLLDNRTKARDKKRNAMAQYQVNLNAHSKLKEEIASRQSMLNILGEQISKHREAKDKMDKISELVKQYEAKMSNIKEEVLVYEAVSAALSPTGAQAYVVDSAIAVFNDKVSDYISMIWPNASYELQSFKENKSGDIKAKFSDKLVIQGTERSVGSLSGGEYRCLSLAVDFAVVDTVESMFGISINPIILDEPFEGLDSLNRERAVEILENIGTERQVWIVDHASEAKSMFSNIVKIEKKNGISSIV